MQTLIAVIAGQHHRLKQHPRPETTLAVDYYEARSRAIDGGKPLAVFIGSGKTDWSKEARDSNDAKINEWLHKYICVFIDTDSSGKALAGQFAVAKKVCHQHRTGNSQQFYHSGDVERDDLLKVLKRYADRIGPSFQPNRWPGSTRHPHNILYADDSLQRRRVKRPQLLPVVHR
jgi:hypothetical protein